MSRSQEENILGIGKDRLSSPEVGLSLALSEANVAGAEMEVRAAETLLCQQKSVWSKLWFSSGHVWKSELDHKEG